MLELCRQKKLEQKGFMKASIMSADQKIRTKGRLYKMMFFALLLYKKCKEKRGVVKGYDLMWKPPSTPFPPPPLDASPPL